MHDYVQLKTSKNTVSHVGTDDFCTCKQPSEIAERIIALALLLKADLCDIFVSNISKKWPIEKKSLRSKS